MTVTANFVSGPDDYFIINIWYDSLFGTFAFQPVEPLATRSLTGSEQAGRGEVLEAAACGSAPSPGRTAAPSSVHRRSLPGGSP